MTRRVRMPGKWLRLLLVAGTLLSGSVGAFSAVAACTREKPENVLDCLADAYTTRDSVALSQLLADDYRYCFPHELTCWGRDRDLKAAGAMFRAAIAIQFSVDGTRTVSPGSEPETWILSSAEPTMVIETVVAGETKQFKTGGGTSKIWIRRMTDPKPHFVVFRWFVTDSIEVK